MTDDPRAQGPAGQIEREGFALLRGVFAPDEIEAMGRSLDAALSAHAGPSIRAGAGGVFAARNLESVWPEALKAAIHPPIAEVVAAALEGPFGLVRAIYFDKPPGGGWSLPWHKDLAIAVREAIPSAGDFRHPTVKAGVPHVEAPGWLLRRMITARVHLDPADAANGALRVVPGSHRSKRDPPSANGCPPSGLVEAAPGDVLLMRPLLTHGSGRPAPGETRRRRVLHFEFARDAELPDGLAWHRFIPIALNEAAVADPFPQSE